MFRTLTFTLSIISVLSACSSTNDFDRPNPDYVVTFGDKEFNNAPTLIKEFEASSKLLLVAVSDKESAHKASSDLKSVIKPFEYSKDIFIAYRITNLPTEVRLVEIFDASDKEVPALLSNLKSGSIDQFGRWFSESEMRRFENELYSKQVTLTEYLTLQSQLAALLQNFGWTLLDLGAFLSPEHAPYYPQNLKLEVTTLEPMKATKNEIASLIRSWASNYKGVNDSYNFEIDIATQTVSYEKKPTITQQLQVQLDELF